jgi:hypothetical protein
VEDLYILPEGNVFGNGHVSVVMFKVRGRRQMRKMLQRGDATPNSRRCLPGGMSLGSLVVRMKVPLI